MRPAACRASTATPSGCASTATASPAYDALDVTAGAARQRPGRTARLLVPDLHDPAGAGTIRRSGPATTARSRRPSPTANVFTVPVFNVQRFFDTANDPAVDDAVLTQAAFANRLNKASLAIRQVLRCPTSSASRRWRTSRRCRRWRRGSTATPSPPATSIPATPRILSKATTSAESTSGFLVKQRASTVDDRVAGR